MLDFETCGKDREVTEITQIGAVAIRPSDLRIYDTSFNMRCKVLDESLIEEEALKITRTTIEEIRASPHPKEVWLKFADWVSQFNRGGKTDLYNCPVMAGHNIYNFDMRIYERYCHTYGTLKYDKFLKKKVPGIFNSVKHFDTLQLLSYWTADQKDPRSLSLDNLRKYMGMSQESKDNAHDALQDVYDTAAILQRLFIAGRVFAPKVHWKNCFDPVKYAEDKAERAAEAAAQKEQRRRARV